MSKKKTVSFSTSSGRVTFKVTVKKATPSSKLTPYQRYVKAHLSETMAKQGKTAVQAMKLVAKKFKAQVKTKSRK